MGPTDFPNLPPSLEPALVDSPTLDAIHPVAYGANTILFRAGDADDRLYIILAGEVALFHALGTKDERLIEIRGAGELIGEMSFLIPNMPHKFSARVHEDAWLLELHRGKVDTVLRREPLLVYEMLRVTTSHLHQLHKRTIQALNEKHVQLTKAYTELRDAELRLLDQERLQHEMRLAREMQERMLPATIPQLAGFDIAARIIPAHEVGGDFFDVFVLDNETLGLVIGDVCGKGMPQPSIWPKPVASFAPRLYALPRRKRCCAA